MARSKLIKKDLFMVNGNVYGVINNTIFKCFDSTKGFFGIMTKEEKNLVKDKLKRNENGQLFKSQKLNEIAEKNPELKTIDIFEEILDDIEKETPEEYRDTLYKNLEKMYITFEYEYKRSKKEEDIAYSIPASYDIKDNMISIYLKDIKEFHKSSLENNDKKKKVDTLNINFHDYMKRILIHELLHLSSRNKYENDDNLYCGLSITVDERYIYNDSINEAMTEIKSRKIFSYPPFDNNMGYMLQICILSQIIDLIGYEVVEKSYYENLGPSLIEKELLKINNDPLKVKTLTFILNHDNAGTLTDENIEILTLVQSLLLEYYEIKINKYYENPTIENIGKAVKLFDDLEKNFINIFVDDEYKCNDFTNINLDKIHKIQEEKFCNYSYRRRKKRK